MSGSIASFEKIDTLPQSGISLPLFERLPDLIAIPNNAIFSTARQENIEVLYWQG